MGRISFNPSVESIVLRLEVGGVDPNTFRYVTVALDTGASITIIPSQVLIALGYDLLNPDGQVQLLTANGITFAKRINVRRLTTIGETIENIDVLCHDLPKNSPIKGLLGLNFLRHFDVNISFSTGTIELHPY